MFLFFFPSVLKNMFNIHQSKDVLILHDIAAATRSYPITADFLSVREEKEEE